MAAVNANQVTSETLSKPLNSTFDKILNVITFGIYASFKNSATSEMKNDILDIGAALIKWDPDTPEIPLSLTLKDRNYEIFDMPNGGIRLHDCASGESKEFENVSLKSMREMIFFDLMTQSDFADAMDNRLYEASTTHVDILGIKQERANGCGDASRGMILAYHGLDYAPATNDRFILNGLLGTDLIGELKQSGLKPHYIIAEQHRAYTSEQIRQGLENGPLLCELDGHFVVIHGVNEMFDRVDIFCPLLGNRSASLADLNEHLDWNQKWGEAPLTSYTKTDASGNEASTAFGKNLDPDFSASIIDRMGVSLLATGYAMGNSWLQSPEAFAAK